MSITRVLGIDPGLHRTGWGVVEFRSGLLRFIGCGLIKTKPVDATAKRLVQIDAGLADVLRDYTVDEAAVEESISLEIRASARRVLNVCGAYRN